MLCSVYCHDSYYFMIQVISSSCFLCLFSMNTWVGWFLMNDFQAFLFFSQVLPGFPYFQITSDYLFHVFTGCSLGNIAQASKVPHLLDQAFCSILSRLPNHCSLLFCTYFLMLFNFRLVLSSSAEILCTSPTSHLHVNILVSFVSSLDLVQSPSHVHFISFIDNPHLRPRNLLLINR